MKTTNTIKIIGMAAIATLALSGCGSSSGGASSNAPEVTAYPYDAPAISEAQKNEFLSAINNARSVGRSCGGQGWFDAAPALSWDNALYTAAYEHTNDITINGLGDGHTGSGTNSDWTAQVQELGRGSRPNERAYNNGSTGGIQSENTAQGYGSTNAVISGWLSSDGHCAGLMSKHVTKVGMAKIGTSWTQNFSN